MDEQETRLAKAFRAAAADAPPPGFDVADVVSASRRITRRRRSALAGAALAVVAVAGVGVTAGLARGPGAAPTTASAGSAQVAPEDAAAPEAAPVAGPSAAAAAGSVGAASDTASGPAPPAPDRSARAAAPPLGPGTGECADRQDPALRALVDEVLPEVAGAPEAMTTQECRPGGEREVGLVVRDGAASGLLSVTYLPPGMAADSAGAPDDARAVPTASGGFVVVAARPDRFGDPAPFAGRLDALSAALAPRL